MGTSKHSFFRLESLHTRLLPTRISFTSKTWVVRVDLPESQPRAIRTRLGRVLPSDHLLPTVQDVQDRFGRQLGRPVARVELITHARRWGERFGPMSLYLGFFDASSTEPDFLVYEPGDVMGRPGALYLADPVEREVVTEAGYEPTPLAKSHFVYSGRLELDAERSGPAVLRMQAARVQGVPPHFELVADYVPVAAVPLRIPFAPVLEAVVRMVTIERAVGTAVGMVSGALSWMGRHLVVWRAGPWARRALPKTQSAGSQTKLRSSL